MIFVRLNNFKEEGGKSKKERNMEVGPNEE